MTTPTERPIPRRLDFTTTDQQRTSDFLDQHYGGRLVSAGRDLSEQAVIRLEAARWAEWGLDPAAVPDPAVPTAGAPAVTPG